MFPIFRFFLRVSISVFAGLLLSISLVSGQCPDLNFSWFSLLPALPVQVASSPYIGTNDDGRLEVFVLGSDHAVWHSWQVQENLQQWSAWSSLGHPDSEIFGLNDDRVPVMSVTKDRAGRLQVFVVNGAVWQIGQVAKNVNWTGWRSLGRPTSPDGGADAVWSVANADGRIELFVRNTGNLSLQHMWQLGDAFSWNGTFTEFGWPAGFLHDHLDLALDPTGRIVLATINDARVHVRRQRLPNADWEGWQQIPLPNASTRFNSSMISLGQNADGRLELLAGSIDNTVWHTWQAFPQGGNAAPWTNQWASFGSPVGQGDFLIDQRLVQGLQGCLTTVALCQFNSVLESRVGYLNQKIPSASWKSWQFQFVTATRWRAAGRIAVARDRAGQLRVFVRNDGSQGGIITAVSSKR